MVRTILIMVIAEDALGPFLKVFLPFADPARLDLKAFRQFGHRLVAFQHFKRYLSLE
jgi:hypothetical protein